MRSSSATDQSYRFIDTAGIRRKGKTELMAEKLSVVMARKHLEAADVVLMVIDATEGVTGARRQHRRLRPRGRAARVILVINKWDLVTTDAHDGKPPADRGIFEQQARSVLKFLDYAPIVFVSASTGRNVRKDLSHARAGRPRAPQARHHRRDEPLPAQGRLRARLGAGIAAR